MVSCDCISRHWIIHFANYLHVVWIFVHLFRSCSIAHIQYSNSCLIQTHTHTHTHTHHTHTPYGVCYACPHLPCHTHTATLMLTVTTITKTKKPDTLYRPHASCSLVPAVVEGRGGYMCTLCVCVCVCVCVVRVCVCGVCVFVCVLWY